MQYMQREEGPEDIQSSDGVEMQPDLIDNGPSANFTKQPANDDLGLDGYYQENSSDDGNDGGGMSNQNDPNFEKRPGDIDSISSNSGSGQENEQRPETSDEEGYDIVYANHQFDETAGIDPRMIMAENEFDDLHDVQVEMEQKQRAKKGSKTKNQPLVVSDSQAGFYEKLGIQKLKNACGKPPQKASKKQKTQRKTVHEVYGGSDLMKTANNYLNKQKQKDAQIAKKAQKKQQLKDQYILMQKTFSSSGFLAQAEDPLEFGIQKPIEEEKDERNEETERRSPKKKQLKIYSDVMHDLDAKAMRQNRPQTASMSNAEVLQKSPENYHSNKQEKSLAVDQSNLNLQPVRSKSKETKRNMNSLRTDLPFGGFQQIYKPKKKTANLDLEGLGMFGDEVKEKPTPKKERQKVKKDNTTMNIFKRPSINSMIQSSQHMIPGQGKQVRQSMDFNDTKNPYTSGASQSSKVIDQKEKKPKEAKIFLHNGKPANERTSNTFIGVASDVSGPSLITSSSTKKFLNSKNSQSKQQLRPSSSLMTVTATPKQKSPFTQNADLPVQVHKQLSQPSSFNEKTPTKRRDTEDRTYHSNQKEPKKSSEKQKLSSSAAQQIIERLQQHTKRAERELSQSRLQDAMQKPKDPVSWKQQKESIMRLTSNASSAQIKRKEEPNEPNSGTVPYDDPPKKPSVLAKKQSLLMKEGKEEKGTKIICQTISVQPFMRRAVQKMDWQESLFEKDTRFHIKFDVADIDVKVKPYQIYNHFPGNRELTTKAGLAKNLWFNCQYETQLKISEIFPRCYDLSDTKQCEHFIEDYERTFILSTIKVYALQFQNDGAAMISYQDYMRKDKFASPQEFLSQHEQRCLSYDRQHGSAPNENVKQALRYANSIIADLTQTEREKKIFMWPPRLNEEGFQNLLVYSEQLIENPSLIQHNIPLYDKTMILKCHFELMSLIPQYSTIDGTKNVWIVKPSFNARGHGIYLTNNLKDILQVGTKCSQKIVQKYIENPLLLQGKKFDVRQWVLVTSWDPLEVFVFDTAYLKLCSSDFSLSDLDDVFKHLSNYSIQKANETSQNTDLPNEASKSNLVWTAQDFENYIKVLKTPQNDEFCWQEDMLPKIKDAVYRALKCIQDSQISECTNCFEVYGFDLVIDEHLNPYVIEINLSPACSERHQYLTKMLDDMALGLCAWVERKVLMMSIMQQEREVFTEELRGKKDQYIRNRVYYENLTTLNTPEFYKANKISHFWVKVDECLEEMDQWNKAEFIMGVNQVPHLEIVGGKCDLRTEKKIDVNFKKKAKVAIIQRAWRGYLGRKTALRRRQMLAAILIQKNMRMVLAKLLKKRLKFEKSCTYVQIAARRILALNEVKRRIECRMQEAREFVALRLQSHFRRREAQRILVNLRLNAKARMIQKFLRGYMDFQSGRQKLYVFTMVIRLQKFYLRRYKHKNTNAVRVQSKLKGFLASRKWKKIRQIQEGFKKVRQMVERSEMELGLFVFSENVQAIRIQRCIRRFLAQKHVQKLREERAQENVRRIVHGYINQTVIKRCMIELRWQMTNKAIVIQKAIKQYRLVSRIRKLNQFLKQHNSSVLIQRMSKGFLARQQVKQQSRQRLKAAIKIQSIYRMIKPRRVLLKARAESKKAQKEKEEAVQKLNKYLEGLKQDDNYSKEIGSSERAQRIEGEICQMIEQKPLRNSRQSNEQEARQQHKGTNARSTAINKYFNRKGNNKQEGQPQGTLQPHIIPTGKKQKNAQDLEISKAQQRIKDLENQFYGRKASDAKEEISSLPVCLPEVRTKSQRNKSTSKRQVQDNETKRSSNLKVETNAGKESKYSNKYINQISTTKTIASTPVEGRQPKMTFAENLKNLLSKQHLDEPSQIQVKSDIPRPVTSKLQQNPQLMQAKEEKVLNELVPSVKKMIQKNPSAQNLVMELDDISTHQQYSIFDSEITESMKEQQLKDVQQRPVKDPRSEALRNIENKSMSSLVQSSVQSSVQQQRHSRLNSGVRQQQKEVDSFGKQVLQHLDTYQQQKHQRISDEQDEFYDPKLQNEVNCILNDTKTHDISHGQLVRNALLESMTVRKGSRLSSIGSKQRTSQNRQFKSKDHQRQGKMPPAYAPGSSFGKNFDPVLQSSVSSSKMKSPFMVGDTWEQDQAQVQQRPGHYSRKLNTKARRKQTEEQIKYQLSQMINNNPQSKSKTRLTTAQNSSQQVHVGQPINSQSVANLNQRGANSNKNGGQPPKSKYAPGDDNLVIL